MTTPLTERGGVLLTNNAGGFQAYLTIAGTDEWMEIAWRPENSLPLHTATISITPEKLAAHIRKNFVGWTARKTNLPHVPIKHNAKVTALPST